MKDVNVAEGQTMEVLRYANRVPLQFQPASCAITQTMLATNWRSYGLSQSRGSMPKGPVTVMVHIASVWVPFTSESKEAIASYPEIQKELRLGAAGGRPQPRHVRPQAAQGEAARRSPADFPALPGRSGRGRERNQRASTETRLYDQLVAVAKKRTSDADMKLDERGKAIEDDELELGKNVLIVDPLDSAAAINRTPAGN